MLEKEKRLRGLSNVAIGGVDAYFSRKNLYNSDWMVSRETRNTEYRKQLRAASSVLVPSTVESVGTSIY